MRPPSNNLFRACLPVLLLGLFVTWLWTTVGLLQKGLASPTSPTEFNTDRLYRTTNLVTVHLRFAPESWKALSPPAEFNPFAPRGGRMLGNSIPARALASLWMREADRDRDGALTRREWEVYTSTWYQQLLPRPGEGPDEAQVRRALDALPNPVATGITGLLLAPEGKRNGIAAAFGLDFDYVRADVELDGRLFPNVGIRYKGNGTFLEARDTLKRSFKIRLNHFVPHQRLEDVETLNLQNQITDASYMNEVLAYRLYRDAGVPAPRTAYARVYLTVPGQYHRHYLGLYSLTEAVDRHFLLRHFGTRRGALFKPVTSSLFADLGSDWAAYQQIYDPKIPLFPEHKKRLIDLARCVTHADDRTFAARIGEYIDLPEFARFLAVMVYLSDIDGLLGPGQNFFLHLHPKTLRFQFIPWDQDRSWGQFDRASQEQRDELSIHQPWQGQNAFLQRMFNVESFKQLYLAALREFSQTIFDPHRIALQVDEIAAAIRPAVQEESLDKLAAFDRVVAGELLPRRGFGPFGGAPVKPIKPFAQVRTASIRAQLAGQSPGRTLGPGFPGMGPPGSPGGSGLGILGQPMMERLDVDRNGRLTHEEFVHGTLVWFSRWDTNRDGCVRFAELYAGLAQELQPPARNFPPRSGPPQPPPQPNNPSADPADARTRAEPIRPTSAPDSPVSPERVVVPRPFPTNGPPPAV